MCSGLNCRLLCTYDVETPLSWIPDISRGYFFYTSSHSIIDKFQNNALALTTLLPAPIMTHLYPDIIWIHQRLCLCFWNETCDATRGIDVRSPLWTVASVFMWSKATESVAYHCYNYRRQPLYTIYDRKCSPICRSAERTPEGFQSTQPHKLISGAGGAVGIMRVI